MAVVAARQVRSPASRRRAAVRRYCARLTAVSGLDSDPGYPIRRSDWQKRSRSRHAHARPPRRRLGLSAPRPLGAEPRGADAQGAGAHPAWGPADQMSSSEASVKSKHCGDCDWQLSIFDLVRSLQRSSH